MNPDFLKEVSLAFNKEDNFIVVNILFFLFFFFFCIQNASFNFNLLKSTSVYILYESAFQGCQVGGRSFSATAALLSDVS